MRRRTVGLTVLCAAAASVVAAVTIPADASTEERTGTARPAVSATADPGTGGTPAASAEMLAALQRDLRLSPEQARTRLARETRAARSEAQLRAALGPKFAGSWLSKDAGGLIVAVTDADSAEQVRAAGAEARVVRRDASRLDAVKAGLDRAGKKASDAVTGWYVDETTNTVVVTASDTAAAKKFVSASGQTPGDVRVVQNAESPRLLHDVRGGDAFFMGGGRCSVGFSVQGGFVTAGHCGKTGTAASGFNRVAQGTFAGSSFPGDDYALVRTNANWTPQPFVNDYKGGNVVVAGGEEAPVGASICRSGSTTGWHCGVVQAKNATVNYPEGQVGGLTRTNVCAEPGDSGGAWISGQQAQGVTSGGSGNCTSGGTTYFQPLTEILSVFNVALVTQGGGGTPSPSQPPASSAPAQPSPSAPASPTPSPTASTPQPPAATAWQSGKVYNVGDRVGYQGMQYVCQVRHRAYPGWVPPRVPFLWRRL